MGQEADVRIESLQAKVAPVRGDMVLVASPEPGARLARQNRFTLQWVDATGRRNQPPVAAGYALASVFVAVEHVRAARPVARGEACDGVDLLTSRGEVGAVLLQRLPRLSEVAGTRAARDLMADEVVTRTALVMRPMVQSGDVVAVRATADGVTVQGQAVAQQSGGEGDIIRVVNRESRRTLRARVVGPGKVEVLQ
jgi:flagella basal body P-ring formation protein FlgA